MVKKPKVLIVIVRYGPKTYCWDFFPEFVNKITYENKEILLVDEKNCKELQGDNLGETICSKGRNYGIHYARKKGFDYIFDLDLDLEPESDCIDKMLSLNYPLVGGLVAARGNAYQIIGHSYKNEITWEREPLYYPDLKTGDEVDGISGAALLVGKELFMKYDYSEYTGPDTIRGRFTADDEFFQMKIREGLHIRPKIIKELNWWHYNDDGYKYQLLGKKQRYEQRGRK